MPVVQGREYRNMATLTALNDKKRFDSEYYVEGYATSFDQPYLLGEFRDGTKFYEVIEKGALDGADMSDVIMQYDHEGRVFARTSNNTLIAEPDEKGIFIAADLSKTANARNMHEDINAEMINKMSWSFIVAKEGDYYTEDYENKTYTRHIRKIKKCYDVSAVSIPANNDGTEINARCLEQRSVDQAEQELIIKRAALLKLKIALNI